MPIDRFTKERFEQALPVHKDTEEQLWRSLGLVMGEEVYGLIIPDTNKRIVIRSSVQANGLAADVGNDSIRHWVEYHYKGSWRPLSRGNKTYTTRVPGWEERLTIALRELWSLALADSKRRGRWIAV